MAFTKEKEKLLPKDFSTVYLSKGIIREVKKLVTNQG
jgi:hypothetical protein